MLILDLLPPFTPFTPCFLPPFLPLCRSYLHRPVLHDGLQHTSPVQMHSLWEHAMLQGDNLPISRFCSLVLVSDLRCHILAKKSNRESMIKILEQYILNCWYYSNCANTQHISDLPRLPYKINFLHGFHIA